MTTPTDTRPPGPPAARGLRPVPLRRVEWLPTVALGIAFAIKAAVQPNAVRDVFSGAQAFLVASAILVAWVLLWRVVLPRLVHNTWVRVAILSVVAGLLIYWLVVSALVDKKVVETLPGARGEIAQPSHESDPTPPPAAPVQLALGELRGIDHDATGTAALYQRPDGSFIVGLEEIDIEPGPDYKVYVAPGADRQSPGDDAVFLDGLRGNEGTQYYDVPEGTRLDDGEWTVLIWCRAFAVPIANSTPS